MVTVGFRETNSTFDESAGMFIVCVRKDRATARDVSLAVSDTEITATEPDGKSVQCIL